MQQDDYDGTELTQRTQAALNHLETGNGDWHANRKLVAHVMKEQGKFIDELFVLHRQLNERLHRMEVRIASYVGGGIVILWLIEKVMLK